MSLIAWFRPPSRLLLLFLAVTLLPATGLIWLGWRLLQQDRELMAQRIQGSREQAADRIVAALEQQLLAAEPKLAGRGLQNTTVGQLVGSSPVHSSARSFNRMR